MRWGSISCREGGQPTFPVYFQSLYGSLYSYNIISENHPQFSVSDRRLEDRGGAYIEIGCKQEVATAGE